MADRFYTNSPLGPGQSVIQGPEAHHLATVLRARAGDAVCLFNGDGAEYPGIVVEVAKKHIVVEVTGRDTPPRELGWHLEVAVPLPKGDRGDFLMEKLTEIGVTDFVPLRTRRSVVHPRATARDKLERAVVEASKQCGRNVLMRVHEIANWDDYCRRRDLPAKRLLAHPGGDSLTIASAGDVAIAVGPEGGFTEEEVALAGTCHWQWIGLGPRILRVETAALALALATQRV